MHNYAQKILELPDAPKQIEALQKAMADEQAKRISFREWVTEDQKAEFINGAVLLHSPVKRRHLNVSDNLSMLLSAFVKVHRLGVIMVEKAMIALTRNDYEPDICYFSIKKAKTFTDDQMLFPAPDFVVEIISKKTAANDRGIKKNDYAAHGIREYWIIDPTKQTVEQYLLVNETDTAYFPPYKYTLDNDIESKVIEGFAIPVRAIFDHEANVSALQSIIISG